MNFKKTVALEGNNSAFKLPTLSSPQQIYGVVFSQSAVCHCDKAPGRQHLRGYYGA